MSRTRLLLAFLAITVLAAALYFFESNLRAQLLSDADSALAARARLIADTVERTLQWRMTEVFTFAALPSLRGFAASNDADRPARAPVALVELKAIVAADTSIRAASIVDPSGEVSLTTDGSMQANWGDRLFTREALAGYLYASAPSRDFGEVSQYYSAPLIDNAGNVAAALVVRVAVQELWGALSAPPEVMLIDENGVRIVDRTAAPQTFAALTPLTPDALARVLLDKRYGAVATPITATNLVTLADAIKRQETAALTYRDPNGRTVRAATQRTATYSWTVVVLESEDAILAPAVDALWGVAGVTVVALLAGVVLWAALREMGRKN